METKVEKKEKVVQKLFKKYDQTQKLYIPLDFKNLIPSDHLSRIVDEVIEKIDMSHLESYYKGGGSSPYHPKMMIKVWVYGYCDGVYTSRRLSSALGENVNYMFLSGQQYPCYKTLSSFRSGQLEVMLDVVFKEVLVMLVELGYVDLSKLYVDGSKWEANGNHFKRVWRKGMERYKQSVIERIADFVEQIKLLQEEEDGVYGNKDLAKQGEGRELTIVMTSDMVSQHMSRLQDLIKEEAAKEVSRQKTKSQKTKSDKVKSMERLEKKLEEEQLKLIKYEGQEVILAGRNSYNKTDTDATMLRMKDEQLLPAYNVEHTTSNQYITNFTIEQNASDSPTFIPHLEKMTERFEGIKLPAQISIAADAGYGSEENYAYLEKRDITAYVKYPMWYQEITGELAKKMFRRENWSYDAINNTYTCPNERMLKFAYEKIDVTDNGYERTVSVYQCESCEGCPFVKECKRSEESARTVQHSAKGEAYKQKAKKLLETDEGKEMRRKRSIEVESVFGDIKFNKKHERFVLRGKKKVYIEYGLLSIAHNLRKVYCEKSGVWKDYYAQRAAKTASKRQKRA